MFTQDIIIALKEEIGHPDLFVGRKKELDFFLDWALKTKEELSQSYAILARRKKGKTALVQRLFNILYTQNDPQIIPFYFRIAEGKISVVKFAELFYRSLVSQYYAFKCRKTGLIDLILPFDRLIQLAGDDEFIREDIQIMLAYVGTSDPDLAWNHARDAGRRISSHKNERIIQIIDEFQYLNEYIYRDEACTNKIELASFYQSTAESKVSPQIITGSYIGWLSAIIGKMTARYRSYYLENLTNEDALAAVFNYVNLLKLEITDETASFIATLSEKDPFYISALTRSSYEQKDLTSRESVLEVLKFETSYPGGEIAKVWLEYMWSAFERVNDKNAKRIVLYLAKHGGEVRTREQILKDLNLSMSDGELEQKLHKLVRADIIAYGPTNFEFKGLGDRIFELVFRKVYEKEIENISVGEIETDVLKKLASSRGEVSQYKGQLAEFRVLSRLMSAVLHGIPLRDIVYNPREGISFGRFRSMHKEMFHIDHEKKVEVDIFCSAEKEDGVDFVVEVKDWATPVTPEVVKQFIAKKTLLEEKRQRNTAYIFYSEQGISERERKLLDQHRIMYSDAKMLREYSTAKRG